LSISARQVAFDLLNKVTTEDAYANLLMPALLQKSGLDTRESAFAQELAFSTIRWQYTYDCILNIVSSRPVDQIDPTLLNALRLGAHQLLNMRVPAHAALSETVELVRKNLGEKVVGFSNGVLRRVSEKSFDQWKNLIVEGKNEVETLSILYSHPAWIVQALKQSLVTDGLGDELEALLRSNNTPADVNLVALPGFASRDDYREDDVELDRLSPIGFSLESGRPDELQGFGTGVRVQDEGSQLAALALANYREVGEGETWLDLCAGPGGKAALLAALSKQTGVSLMANEVQEHRADLVRDALSPIDNRIRVMVEDGRLFGEMMPNKFDRILIDAPCTGLGALRRRPEARWRKSASDLKTLTGLQFELLASGYEALKPGGLLLYVTCSPHLSETTAIIDKAMRNLGCEVLDLTSFMNDKYLHGALPAGRRTVQLHTQRDNTDSMFMALITKP
jgi:16S rRNA (cytosine967-C5)-methyltransferase